MTGTASDAVVPAPSVLFRKTVVLRGDAPGDGRLRRRLKERGDRERLRSRSRFDSSGALHAVSWLS